MSSTIKENLKLTGYLLMAGFGMTYLLCPGCRDLGYNYLVISLYSSSIWIFLWIGNSTLSHWLDQKISWVTSPVKRFIVGIISLSTYTVVALYLIVEFFRITFDVDVSEDLRWIFISSLCITFLITLFMHGREFLSNWKQAALDAERLKKESFQAQFESLRSQVNPHFLFNSLNALSNLVHENPDKAVLFIKKLSEVYRYVLDTRDREVVPIQEEIEFLNSYIYLQQIRFGEKLKFSVSLNGLDSTVAPLSLQMLIENAIKHNIISEQQHLHIELSSEADFLVVKNNLQPKQGKKEESHGYGLENIKRRYAYLSERKVEVKAEDGSFIVKLPKLDVPS
ncbi:MAG: histidine kinase [Flammeovirgaceae bacterium]|nr:histidine kinase [Flammeovirgaceae bacterium]